MIKFLAYLLITVLLVLGIQKSGIFVPKPCTTPIAYAIGSYDKRFGLSQADFLKAAAQAESIWEKKAGRELFTYAPAKPGLLINLIYDYRQEATKALNVIQGEVNSDEASYRALQKSYAQLKAVNQSLKAEYDLAVGNFQTHTAAYEASVEHWNSGERTSQAEFAALEGQRQMLESELSAVKELESRLNASVREVNNMVARLNTLARELNLNVEEYNSVGAERGETFTGGLYTYDSSGERIDIYQFESREKLVRILAHELGHALGLEHVGDKEAIMYELNKGDKAEATAADLAALTKLCSL